MDAQGRFCSRCIVRKLNAVVWTSVENIIFGELPDFDRGLRQSSKWMHILAIMKTNGLFIIEWDLPILLARHAPHQGGNSNMRAANLLCKRGSAGSS